MLAWIFITTIHLTIIHQIYIIKLKSVNLTTGKLTIQQLEIRSLWYTPKDPRREMAKDVEASLNNNEKKIIF